MKLKITKKNLFILAGFFLLCDSTVQVTYAAAQTQILCPTKDTEVVLIDGFAKDIPTDDNRSFNQIIDEVLCLVSNNYEFFRQKLTGSVVDPDVCLQNFTNMIAGLKTKKSGISVAVELNKYKDVFDKIVPQAMNELLKTKPKTLKVLNQRIKRNS